MPGVDLGEQLRDPPWVVVGAALVVGGELGGQVVQRAGRPVQAAAGQLGGGALQRAGQHGAGVRGAVQQDLVGEVERRVEHPLRPVAGGRCGTADEEAGLVAGQAALVRRPEGPRGQHGHLAAHRRARVGVHVAEFARHEEADGAGRQLDLGHRVLRGGAADQGGIAGAQGAPGGGDGALPDHAGERAVVERPG